MTHDHESAKREAGAERHGLDHFTLQSVEVARGEAAKADPAIGATPQRQEKGFDLPPAPGKSKFFTEANFVPHKSFDHGAEELLLPLDLADRLAQLEDERLLQQSEERRLRAEVRMKESELERAQKAQADKEAKSRDASAVDVAGKGDPKAYRQYLEKLPKKRRLQVYAMDAVEKLRNLKTSDTEVHKRNETLASFLIEAGPCRRVGAPRNVQAVLDLNRDHPHFGEVIDFVANHAALQRVSPKPLRLPPMLFYGAPGVGKTHFTEALAKVLGVPVRRHPMDQAETSSAFLGSEKTWGNSHYGLVFELLGLGDWANPVVILDELDKAQSLTSMSGRGVSPTTVLHSLLEPVSSAHVRDNSLELELDASLISWIATANYPQLIAPTLRSRLREFLIMPPTAEQAIQVARSVVRNAISATGVAMAEPDKRVILALTPLSAREIYQVVVAAVAKALAGKQRVLGLEHLPQELLDDDAQDAGEHRAQLH